jgi:uncharacterized protein involved in exopolysaccharide biosynthesis
LSQAIPDLEPDVLDPQIAAETVAQEPGDKPARARILAHLRLLWTRRRFLLRCVVVGFVVATLVAFLIPSQFESTAQLMPPDSRSPSNIATLAGMTDSGGLGTAAADLLGVKSTGALFAGVLRSRTVQDRIVGRFELKKVYGKRLQAQAREQLAERTAISEDRKSGIITVTVTDRDARRAAAIASAYLEELNTLIAQLSTSSARRERVFLEGRLETVKQDLENAESDFSRFASSNGAIDIPEQGKAMVEAAAALEGQLIAARSELQGLKQIFADNNVRVRSTQARIDTLHQQLQRISGRAAGASETGDGPAADSSYPTLRQLPILGVPYADKLRRLRVEETVYETLTKQYELAKVQEAKEVPSVKELDAPVVPEQKSFPPRLVLISLGVFWALFAGVVWVLGASRWREIDPQDPGRVFAREVLHTCTARIPWIARNGGGKRSPETEVQTDEAARPNAKGAGAGAEAQSL